MSQSSTSLLDEVEQWSLETCRQELKSVLPKLTSLHHESDNWDEHTRILRAITQIFLPHIGLTEVEEGCFSKVLPKAVTVFNGMMKELMDQVGGLSSQNTELRDSLRTILQGMMQIIDAVCSCVHHVCSFEEAPALDTIRSLPSCALKILKETFQHCKDSEVLYCGRLSLVADLLQGLFKEAYSLHKGLLEMLDRLSLETHASDEEVSDIVTVIHNLLDICSVISNLDIALHANTWKFLIKQSLKYRALVEEHLHHNDISNSLCDNLLLSFHNCVELAEQIKCAGLQESPQSTEFKLFQKTAKMCRFFANTLVHYIKEYKDFLTKCCNKFHQVYLQIINKFPPSLSAPSLPPNLSGELNGAALVPMDAFLLQLLPLRPFAEVVLQVDLRPSSEHELAHCLLLVNIMGQLTSQPEEVLQLWLGGSQFSEETPRLPLYKGIFNSFRQCHIERKVPVQLPGVMLKGQAQAQVSLHRYICVQLCASVAVLPPAHFHTLERCLIDAVLQADTQTALLGTDVWCFCARYGSAELCLHHVLLVAQLVKACPPDCYQMLHLGLLLKRMVFFMVPNHQIQLVEHFPPSEQENLVVWGQILFRALSKDIRLRVETDIISLSQKVLTDWEKEGHKLAQMNKVNVVLSSLLSVVRGPSSPVEQFIEPAVKIVSQIWLRMSPAQIQSQPVLQQTLLLLLSVTTLLVKSIEPSIVCEALSCLGVIVSSKCPDQLQFVALDFLSSLGKIFVPPDSQGQIFSRLSGLFAILLADESWLVHQHALEAFSLFAENTNHEEVISQSLYVEDTKTKVVNYLSKTLNSVEDCELRLQRLREETPVVQLFIEKLENMVVSNQPAPEHEALVTPEPCPKRARHEAGTEEEYTSYLQTAESALKALLLLIQGSRDTTTPLCLEPKLQELQMLITQLRSS